MAIMVYTRKFLRPNDNFIYQNSNKNTFMLFIVYVQPTAVNTINIVTCRPIAK
jgi:hypothetical protein